MLATNRFARPAMLPKATVYKSTTDFVRLFALDRAALPAGRQRLICRWHVGVDGRPSCTWEPETDSVRRF